MESAALIYAILLLVVLFIVSWLFISFIIYFVPTIVAKIRRHKNTSAILILNIITGWTFFGWLASLLWALNSDIESENQIN